MNYLTQESMQCAFCQKDPFEYVSVDGVSIAVAISCCEAATYQYYQGLTEMSSGNGGDLMKTDNASDS